VEPEMPKKINQFIKASMVSIVFALFAIHQPAKAELNVDLPGGNSLELLGIGMHQELRNDIYIGALYGPAGTNVDDLMNDSVAKRMSIRLVSKYSHRKMSRHWKERLAMNNPRSSWQPLTKEIVQFSRIFKRSLQTGDELNIDHIPGTGTQIYLNGTLFQTIKKDGFASLLLNVWLGATPPTKAFKSSIRGQDADNIKSGYVTTYDALQPIEGRFDADLTKSRVAKATPQQETKKNTSSQNRSTSAKNAQTKVASKKQTQKPASKPPVKVAKNETKKSASQATKKTAESKTASNKTSTSNKSNSEITAKPEFKPEIEIDSGFKQELAKNTTSTSTSKKATEDKKVEKVASLDKSSLPEPEPELEEDFFDADLISGSYTRDLLGAIKQFQQYPKKALKRNEEGEVVVKVTINASGEVESIDYLEKSGSRILDKAVLRMVRKAAPFQEIPKELKMDTFEFEVPFSFQL